MLLFQDAYLVAFPADYLQFLDLFSFIQLDWFRVPAMYAYMLFSRRDDIDPSRKDPSITVGGVVYAREAKVNYLKFLYDAYKPKYFWMEVLECGRKLALTGFVVFIAEGSALQAYTGILVSVVAVMVYCYTRPFLFKSNNYFSIFAHTQITVTLIGVSMLRYQHLPDSIFTKLALAVGSGGRSGKCWPIQCQRAPVNV